MSFLEVKGINYALSDSFELKDISFEIDKKGVYAFLGKSGSGKTLLAQILSGSRQTKDGVIKYNDVALYEKEGQTAAVKKKIGYVPQKCFFDREDTAFEALDLVGKAKNIDPDKRYRQIKEALELTGLSERDEVLVSDMSLSERKRLCIAAALLGNPSVIIMDEPFQYMDKKQADGIKNIIDLLRERKVILIFTSRHTDLREISDNIAFLYNGKIVLWQGTEEIFTVMEENKLGNLANAYEAFAEA